MGSVWQKLTRPMARREDDARREYILCVLLVFMSTLSVLFSISVASLAIILGTARLGISVTTSIFISGFFLALLAVARKGGWKICRYLFLGAITLPTLYSFARWGTLLPIPLLALSLIIILSGILINTRAAILMAAGFGSYLGLLNYAHQHNLLSVDESWMQRELYANYSIEITIILMVISGIIWLAYKEIENSLRRARRSEAMVKKERDRLESRVIERTKELEQEQIRALKDMSRLAEIGTLSAGLLHDLINPLTAVRLYLDRLSKPDAAQAMSAAKRLSDLIDRIRQELSGQQEKKEVGIDTILQGAIDAVQHNANQAGTRIVTGIVPKTNLLVNPLHVHRAIVNILINAIEACEAKSPDGERIVEISYTANNDNNILIIKDNGCGMEPALLPHIFEPFFSSKLNKGIGLGLHIAQELLRQELGAAIAVESQVGSGTTFIITWQKN